MASMSTCFTITPNSFPKPSSISQNPSRQFHISPTAHNYVSPAQSSRLQKQHCLSSNNRRLVSEIRYGYDADPSAVATAMASPGKIIESDKLPKDVRKRAMDAVDKCGRRVTVGDVARTAGMKVTEAQKALQAIAADTNGFLEVSDEGDILYVFPDDYRSKLASKSLWIKSEPYIEKAKVFSFVFGDGDPNEGVEEQRWKMIGQYIGSNNGVVTAEELAPYLDVETVVKTDSDSYVLPVLLRFDGDPHVDKQGNILYRFPSLQRRASLKQRSETELEKMFRARVGGPHNFFKENKWEFSKTNKTERALIGGFGGLNLFGVIVPTALMKTVEIEPTPFISFVFKILPILQLYAASFFAIPLARWIFIQIRNAEIEKRNRARELHAQALELPDATLKQKILSAQDMSEGSVIGEYRIVYSTKKDVTEQTYDEDEWDGRLKRKQKPG